MIKKASIFVCILTSAILFHSGCSTMKKVTPDELPRDKQVHIAGAGLETKLVAVTLVNDSIIAFDSVGGSFNNKHKEIRGRSLEENKFESIKLNNVKFAHIASCDPTQCVSVSMDIETLKLRAHEWTEIDDEGNKVPPLELIEFTDEGALYDGSRNSITGQTRRGDLKVEFDLDHVGFLRINSLEKGQKSREFGLRGSFNIAGVRDGGSPDHTTNSNFKADFSVGIVGRQWFSPAFCLQGELDLVRHHAGITYTVTNYGIVSTVEENLKLTYLEIPVLARYRLKQNDTYALHVYAGPYAGFNFDAYTEFDSTQSYGGFVVGAEGTAEITNVSNVVYGLCVGGDIQLPLFGMNSWLDIRYSHGLSSVVDGEGATQLEYADGYRPLIDEDGSARDLKTSRLDIALGISLPY